LFNSKLNNGRKLEFNTPLNRKKKTKRFHSAMTSSQNPSNFIRIQSTLKLDGICFGVKRNLIWKFWYYKV